MWDPVSGQAALARLAAQADGTGDFSVAPYAVVLIVGFLVGAWGHAAKSRWLVAIGIVLVILAVVLFQVEVRTDTPQDLPPGV